MNRGGQGTPDATLDARGNPHVYGTGAFSVCKWGPSSEHRAGVNHLFGDGRAQTLIENFNMFAYYALTTRAGREPVTGL